MSRADTIMYPAGPVLQVFTPTRILSRNRIDVGECVAFPLGAGSVRGFPVGATHVTFSATVACELMTPRG